MHKAAIAAVAAAVLTGAPAYGQARGGGAAATVTPAELKCPMVLGEGVETKRTFCDVPITSDPAEGIVVTIPPHTGEATLRFDLHNRHTYSEQQIKNGRGYHRFTANIGVLTMDNFPVSKAAVLSEFRTAADLVDRIAGTGPSGLKAVAPTGTEHVIMTLPAGVEAVSIIGLDLNVVRVDGVDEFKITGRPIAVVSNVEVEYRPAPARRRSPARR